MRTTGMMVLLCSSVIGSQPVNAGDGPSEVSTALSALSLAPARQVGLSAIRSGELLLVGLHASAHGAEAVLVSAVDGSRYSVEVSAELLGHAGALVGQSVSAVAEAAGTSLWIGSELLLFVPSELVLEHHHRSRID